MCYLCYLLFTSDTSTQIISKYKSETLADLVGACRAHAPLWDPILSFLHTFSPKSTRVGGPRLLTGVCPPGVDPGFDQGGPQIVTGLKLPFWGLSFVEFWCWGLIFGSQGGARGPPWIRPWPPLREILDRHWESDTIF